jgi:anti-sigma regulatory factor (Ser/Thr protein kinase)
MMDKLDLEVNLEEVVRVRAFALSVAAEAGLNERQGHDLHLVCEEAVANIVNYSGATRMSLKAWQENNSLYMSFTDDGIPFDPTQYPTPDFSIPVKERRIGGLGIHYIRKLTDSMTYSREDGKNVLTIRILKVK